MDRRRFLQTATCALSAGPRNQAAAADPLTATGQGEVETPRFYRHDIGTAPGRMHEPTAGTDGNVWTSPLDGNLWRYQTQTGAVEIFNLKSLTGRSWTGLHLWPIAHGDDVHLCTPSLLELWVYHRARKVVKQYAFPHEKPAVYGGFVVPGWDHIYFYDTAHASVLKWDPKTRTGRNFPCPYRLTGTLYMTFADQDRHEVWGSTYTGNDLVRFDTKRDLWTGHFRCPLAKATPTPGAKVFGDTLYVSDHLNGRVVPLNVRTQAWGEPIPVPGYREWFGYLSGGWYFRGTLYFCHSTWTGGNSSLDGEPHHFLGSWTVFDPATKRFSRLDIPTRPGETLKYLMSDYCATFAEDLFILAVNRQAPHTVIVLRSRPLG
jgi:streptogramin lyase